MKKFSKRIEDFTCESCGTKVQGDGYTDHCPFYLWSKHVDVSPGDRQEKCQGLMEPIGVIQKRGQYRIVYRCQKCGTKKVVKAVTNDNFEQILELSFGPVKKELIENQGSVA